MYFHFRLFFKDKFLKVNLQLKIIDSLRPLIINHHYLKAYDCSSLPYKLNGFSLFSAVNFFIFRTKLFCPVLFFVVSLDVYLCVIFLIPIYLSVILTSISVSSLFCIFDPFNILMKSMDTSSEKMCTNIK